MTREGDKVKKALGAKLPTKRIEELWDKNREILKQSKSYMPTDELSLHVIAIGQYLDEQHLNTNLK